MDLHQLALDQQVLSQKLEQVFISKFWALLLEIFSFTTGA